MTLIEKLDRQTLLYVLVPWPLFPNETMREGCHYVEHIYTRLCIQFTGLLSHNPLRGLPTFDIYGSYPSRVIPLPHCP